MDVIGVIDLIAGQAVHARGGRRREYAPVAQVAGASIPPGDAAALARTYRSLGIDSLYVADLDAILGGAPQDAAIAALTGVGAAIWLDQAVASLDGAAHARACGAAQVIVGLETLPSWDVLRDISTALGRDRVAFSLDLKDGVPLVCDTWRPDEADAAAMAARAAEAGAGGIIVLDLARVGCATGLDLQLIGRIRHRVPHVRLLAGGGVRAWSDLELLAGAGCDGALVATAVHTGRVDAATIHAARALGSRGRGE